MKKLSIIILNYNTAAMTLKALAACRMASEGIDYEVILVDNASTEPFTPPHDDRIIFIRTEKNFGFAGGVNRGLAKAGGEYIVLLNSDVIVPINFSKDLIASLEKNTADIVGPRFNYPNGSFQPSCGFFPTIARELIRFSMLGKIIGGGTLIYKNSITAPFFKKAQSVDWVSGGCLLAKREVLSEGLDERYFFGVEDFDLCFQTKKKGGVIVYDPSVSVIHYHGFSSGGRRSTASLANESRGMDYFLNKNYQ